MTVRACRFRSALVALALVLGTGCGSSVFAYDPLGVDEKTRCHSDAECDGALCEVETGRCVTCRADSDCPDSAQSCEQGACRLAAGRCTADADCQGQGGKPRCRTSTRFCAECLTGEDCGGGDCVDGTCRPVSGCTPAGATDAAVVRVGGLQILKGEVSGQAYQACVQAGCCLPATDAPGCALQSGLPARCLSFADAVRYCRYVGGRVPDGLDFSRAAGGEDGGRYPWGAAPAPGCTQTVMSDASGDGCGQGAPAASCSKAAGNAVDATGAALGVCDLAGNLWEWTSEPAAAGRVLRGGAFDVQQPDAFQVSFRGYAADPASRLADAGIRCVW